MDESRRKCRQTKYWYDNRSGREWTAQYCDSKQQNWSAKSVTLRSSSCHLHEPPGLDTRATEWATMKNTRFNRTTWITLWPLLLASICLGGQWIVHPEGPLIHLRIATPAAEAVEAYPRKSFCSLCRGILRPTPSTLTLSSNIIFYGPLFGCSHCITCHVLMLSHH